MWHCWKTDKKWDDNVTELTERHANVTSGEI